MSDYKPKCKKTLPIIFDDRMPVNNLTPKLVGRVNDNTEDLKNLYEETDTMQGDIDSLQDDVDGKLDVPETAGTAGQVLTSDGEGGAVWASVGSGEIVVDPTLTVEGAAADAKKTGDEITHLKQDNNELKTALNFGKTATPGYILRATNTGNGSEWAQVGTPTDAQTAQAVADWLNDHPEATTTVQDGSITEAKFSDALKLMAIKDYATPEMYGAKGDGVTDDTAALQACIVSGNYVLLKNSYRITRVLNFNNISNLVITGGKITRNVDQTFNTIVGENCENILIENVEFEGNGNNRNMSYTWKDNVQGCIILASNCKRIFIEKCKITGYNYGISILGSDVVNAPSLFANTAFNGVVRDCTFYNCHSTIDTYGKGLLIDHNCFYDITGIAIEIEPNLAMDESTPNPVNDANFWTSGVGCVVTNNTIINAMGAGVTIHENDYGCLVHNNTIIDFTYGINISSAKNKGMIISDNVLLYQKPQTINSDKRPWAYLGAIELRGRSDAHGNYIWNPVVGILTTGGANVSDNIIDSPVISGIAHFQITDYSTIPNVIKNNTIINHIRNTSAWWGAYAIAMTGGTLNFIVDNIIQSDTQPLLSIGTAYVTGLVSTVQQSTAITASDYKTYSNLPA